MHIINMDLQSSYRLILYAGKHVESLPIPGVILPVSIFINYLLNRFQR